MPPLFNLTFIPRNWADPVLRASTAKALLQQPNHMLMAVGPEAGKPPIEGYVFAHIPPAGVADILSVFTQPDFRHMGRARALLNEVIAQAKAAACTAITLEVRASNNPAINLYQSIGFQKVSTRAQYYQNPAEDALVLSLNLS